MKKIFLITSPIGNYRYETEEAAMDNFNNFVLEAEKTKQSGKIAMYKIPAVPKKYKTPEEIEAYISSVANEDNFIISSQI